MRSSRSLEIRVSFSCRHEWDRQWRVFMERRGSPAPAKTPTIAGHLFDPFSMFHQVHRYGGWREVVRDRRMHDVVRGVGFIKQDRGENSPACIRVPGLSNPGRASKSGTAQADLWDSVRQRRQLLRISASALDARHPRGVAEAPAGAHQHAQALGRGSSAQARLRRFTRSLLRRFRLFPHCGPAHEEEIH